MFYLFSLKVQKRHLDFYTFRHLDLLRVCVNTRGHAHSLSPAAFTQHSCDASNYTSAEWPSWHCSPFSTATAKRTLRWSVSAISSLTTQRAPVPQRHLSNSCQENVHCYVTQLSVIIVITHAHIDTTAWGHLARHYDVLYVIIASIHTSSLLSTLNQAARYWLSQR